MTANLWVLKSLTDMEEIWKPVAGYEGRYEVSNLGRVRSVPRVLPLRRSDGSILNQPRQSKILAAAQHRWGYMNVVLSDENYKRRTLMVHRLVATAFIPNPEGLPFINHKDEDKTNNRADNLEWCDRLYNNTYGTARERMRKKMLKPVGKYDLQGNLLAVYPSAKAAGEANNAYWRNIAKLCAGTPQHKTVKGFVYKYVDKEDKK